MTGISVRNRSVKGLKEKTFCSRISSAQVEKLKSEAESNFTTPSIQKVLGNLPGLTLDDIALSINMQHDDLLKKFHRTSEKSYLEGFGFVVKYLTTSEKGSYILDVRASISFVAKFTNLNARCYLNFLINFALNSNQR